MESEEEALAGCKFSDSAECVTSGVLVLELLAVALKGVPSRWRLTEVTVLLD
jgi:hypothetical protein